MVAKSVQDAFGNQVEDLLANDGQLDEVVTALRAEDHAGLLEHYRDLGDGLAARQSEVHLLPMKDCAQGSLGAALRRSHPGSERIEAFQAWRTVLGLGDDPLSTWRLNAFSAAQNQDLEGLLWIAILLSRIGFSTPQPFLSVGESLAGGWLAGKKCRLLREIDWARQAGRPIDEVRRDLGVEVVDTSMDASHLLSPQKVPAGLWEGFWSAAGGTVDPATITPLVASLGSYFDDRLKAACVEAILSCPEQREIAREPLWPRLEIESLRDYAPGTLGYAYYHLIVDNGFDPEVLNPDLVSGFDAVLDVSNRRILQTHEVWHLVAGYSTSPLHEVAISGFQLAQFGHNYSAMFLATSVTLLTLHLPMFLDPILQVTFEGWQHGRETKPLMPIDWFSLWGEEIDTLRKRFDIQPFESVIPDMAVAA